MAGAADVDVDVAVADIAIWWSCCCCYCCNRSWKCAERGNGNADWWVNKAQRTSAAPASAIFIFISISISLHSLFIFRFQLSLPPPSIPLLPAILTILPTLGKVYFLSFAALELSGRTWAAAGAGWVDRALQLKHEAEARRGPKINAQQMQFVEVNYCVSSLIQLAHDCRVSLIE